MPEQPAAAVMGFVDGDPVHPGTKAAVASETPHVAEDLEKNLLNDVTCVRRVVKKPPGQVVYRSLEASDQCFVSGFFSRPEPFDEAEVFEFRLLFRGKAGIEVEIGAGHEDAIVPSQL
jgi:hypothetical protein